MLWACWWVFPNVHLQNKSHSIKEAQCQVQMKNGLQASVLKRWAESLKELKVAKKHFRTIGLGIKIALLLCVCFPKKMLKGTRAFASEFSPILSHTYLSVLSLSVSHIFCFLLPLADPWAPSNIQPGIFYSHFPHFSLGMSFICGMHKSFPCGRFWNHQFSSYHLSATLGHILTGDMAAVPECSSIILMYWGREG